MEIKKCIKCNQCKIETDFVKDSRLKSGYRNTCLECERIRGLEKYKKNKEQYLNKFREHYRNNPDFHKERQNNRKEYIKEYNKKYNQLNKERLNEHRKKYSKNRRSVDSFFKLKDNIRSLIYQSVKQKGINKSSKTESILGCSFQEFKEHLEKQFKPWMNWENQGKYNGDFEYGWDIDHIIPISTAITEEDLIRLNHYTNLQPLCSYINRSIKKDKLIPVEVLDKIKVIDYQRVKK